MLFEHCKRTVASFPGFTNMGNKYLFAKRGICYVLFDAENYTNPIVLIITFISLSKRI